MKRVLVAALCLAAGGVQAGELYRWVDADGKVHYTDQLPPENAKQSEQKSLSPSVIGTSGPSYAARQAAMNYPVTLWANDCGTSCDEARDYLKKRGVPFSVKNPQASPEDYEALKKLVGEAMVPVLVVGGKPTKGFNKQTWETALDDAGYPKGGSAGATKAGAGKGAPTEPPKKEAGK